MVREVMKTIHLVMSLTESWFWTFPLKCLSWCWFKGLSVSLLRTTVDVGGIVLNAGVTGVTVCTGDAGGNNGEDIQLTTTITHVDGPSEIYRLAGKDAQE